MSKGALAILVTGSTENWAPGRWCERFLRMWPDRPVAMIPEDAIDPALVRYAAVWKPAPGALRGFPNLEVIFNLGAGVDALMADTTLPDVPLVRVAVDDLTARMTEYIVMHVLMHHRRQGYYAESQRKGVWAPKLQWAAHDLRVGIMGMGVLGRDAAEVLTRIGFDVAGWSSTAKSIPGITCFAGEAQFAAFLARTDVLVCLLPLTPQTRGILNRDLFGKLARDGKLGGPVLINAGRGGLQNEGDLLAALDDGEPLPPESRFWSHPKVTLSPHNAADTDADTISLYVAEQIARHERGEALENVVNRGAGY
jgi:glyoxylate/hydroxypyruvate reductase A